MSNVSRAEGVRPFLEEFAARNDLKGLPIHEVASDMITDLLHLVASRSRARNVESAALKAVNRGIMHYVAESDEDGDTDTTASAHVVITAVTPTATRVCDGGKFRLTET